MPDDKLNSWQTLIQAIRWAARKQRPPIYTDNWPDDSVWRHCAISQEPGQREYWRKWHGEHNLPIPACLADYEPPPRMPQRPSTIPLWES